MRQRHLANRTIRIRDRAELVLCVLEQVGVDGAGTHAMLLLERLDGSDVRHSTRQVPQNMQSNRRAGTG